jgi:hypothetical protein
MSKSRWQRKVYLERPSYAVLLDLLEQDDRHGLSSVEALYDQPVPQGQLLPRLRVVAQHFGHSHGRVQSALLNELLEERIGENTDDQADKEWTKAFVSELSNLLTITQSLVIGHGKLLYLARTIRKHLWESEVLASEVRDLKVFCTCRHLAFSTSNHVEGDYVYLVDGVPEPLLLRKHSRNSYRIVGSCMMYDRVKFQRPQPISQCCLSWSQDSQERNAIEIY